MPNRESLIGKVVTYKGKPGKITSVEDNSLSTIIFRLDSGDMFGIKAFEIGNATTDDAELQAFVDNTLNDFNSKEKADRDNQIAQKKAAAERDRQELENAKESAKTDALNDFINKDSSYFSICKNYFKTGNDSKLFRGRPYVDEYAQTYVSEYSKLKNSRISSRGRNVNGIIERTYPGDVTKLMAWLKDAVNSISVTTGKGTTTSDGELIHEINVRDGTDYDAPSNNNKQWSQWKASLSQKKEILDKMPKEVLEWKIDKNSGRTIDETEYGDVYNKVDQTLASNSVVLDLVLNYGFKLGKQK